MSYVHQARNKVLEMFKSGQLDAATTMKLLATPEITNVPAGSGGTGGAGVPTKRSFVDVAQSDDEDEQDEQELIDHIDKSASSLDT